MDKWSHGLVAAIESDEPPWVCGQFSSFLILFRKEEDRNQNIADHKNGVGT
ncbi:hypothetical protein PGB90_003142 [Kerria lacca]